MSQSSSSGQRSWSTKQFVRGCIGSFILGAGLLYGAGFYWVGEWQTGKEIATTSAVSACVQDFLLEPDRGVVFTELKDNANAYQRRRLLRERKWATDRIVAERCDKRIMQFDPASFQLTKQPA